MTPTTVNGRLFAMMVRPTMFGSPPNRRRQRPWLRTMTSWVASASSARPNVRPNAGVTPSSSKNSPLTNWPIASSGSPWPVNVKPLPTTAAVRIERSCAWRSTKSSGVTRVRPTRELVWKRKCSRSASAYGSGRISTPYTTANIAVLTPMPIASVNAAAAVNHGARHNSRTA